MPQSTPITDGADAMTSISHVPPAVIAEAETVRVRCECGRARCRATFTIRVRHLHLARERGHRLVAHRHQSPLDRIVGIDDRFLVVTRNSHERSTI